MNRKYTNEMGSEESLLKENEMIFNVSNMLNFTGLSEPLRKIYITSEPIDLLPLMIYLIVNS